MSYFNRRLSAWYSPNLNMNMEIVSYGSWGRPLLFFPTADADFLEYERFQVIEVLKPFIEQGKIKVYSINSMNHRSWMNSQLDPFVKMQRQIEWDHYISEEVVPYIRHDCRNHGLKIAVAGASFGAFHAFNTLCRYPQFFDTCLAMSGFYDLSPYSEDCHHPELYFHNPSYYLPNLDDSYYLPLLQNSCDIHILTGQGAYEAPDESRRLSKLLAAKEIAHNLDVWGHDIEHDWPAWRKMLRHYVGDRLKW
jgi:esterase/lipase superfamily enzyme